MISNRVSNFQVVSKVKAVCDRILFSQFYVSHIRHLPLENLNTILLYFDSNYGLFSTFAKVYAPQISLLVRKIMFQEMLSQK